MLRWLTSTNIKPAGVGYPLALMGFVLVAAVMPIGSSSEDWIAALIALMLPAKNDFLHVVGCLVLVLLWCRALRAWSPGAVPSAFWSFLIVFGFGLVLELQQAAVPGRTASIIDTALNAMGALIGAYLYVMAARHSKQRSRELRAGGTREIPRDG